MSWFKRFLAGLGIGVGMTIPGVSGGTVAVVFKIYDKLISSISNIFKKFKDSFLFLLPLLIGAIISIVCCIVIIGILSEGFLFALFAFFAGLVLGSLPGIKDEIHKEKPGIAGIIALVISFIVAFGLGIGSVISGADFSGQMLTPDWWFFLVMIPVGFIASIALVVPGVSGNMFLLILGFYTPMVQTAKTLLSDVLRMSFQYNYFPFIGLLCCFGVGVLAGIYVISKIMNFLLNKHRVTTFYAIIGFVIGSIIAIFVNHDIWVYYSLWQNGSTWVSWWIELIIGIILFIGATFGAYQLVRYQRKNKEENICLGHGN